MNLPSDFHLIPDEDIDALVCDCLDLLLSTLPLEQAQSVRAQGLQDNLTRLGPQATGPVFAELAANADAGRKVLKQRFAQLRIVCPDHGLSHCKCHLGKKNTIP